MKRLYKSRTDRVIAGVCGGVGEYLNIDPVLVRIIWVFLSVLGGSGILAYIIGLIIIPEAPADEMEEETGSRKRGRSTSQTIWGIVLLTIGLVVLINQFEVFRFFSSRFWYISWSVIFPIFLIIIGGLILFRKQGASASSDSAAETGSSESESPGLVRLRNERKVTGVCAGLAYYLNIDPTIVRLLWVIGVFATGGIALLLYIILAIVLPESEATFAQNDNNT